MRSFFLFLSCFVVVSVGVNADTISCMQRQCLAVVDAGSTGSRLHVYAYDLDKTKSPVNIKEIWSKKVNPGFATLAPDAINNYLNTLFSDTPTQAIPVYFYATAGMRLLPQPKQQLFYKLLQQWFIKHPQWQLLDSKTITGTEEGLFGWLAVNYELDTLKSPSTTVGVMDMGGASVQVAFPVQPDAQIRTSDKVEFDLFGRHFVLFVHSFLGLGQTEVTHQFLNSPDCFANNYPMPDSLPAQGDATSCQQAISPLLNAVHQVNRIVPSAIASSRIDSWYAIGGVTYLVTDPVFHFTDLRFTNQRLLQQADTQVCHQQWQELSSYYPNNDYLYGYCLFPAYFYALMVHGYGLSPDQEIHYMPSEQSSDWTLGVVLHQSV